MDKSRHGGRMQHHTRQHTSLWLRWWRVVVKWRDIGVMSAACSW